MNNKLIPIAITIVVGIILCGSLLAPVVSDAEKTIGHAVTFENEGYGYSLDVMTSADFSATSTGTAGEETYDVNGVAAEQVTGVNIPAIVTDSFTVQIPAPGYGNLAIIRSATGLTIYASATTTSVTVTCENGTATVDVDGTESTFTYTWMLAISDNGKFIESKTAGKEVYLAEGQDPIIYGRDNTIGYYTYYNGEANASEATVSATYTKSLVDGTTDVYKTANERPKIGNIDAAAVIVPIHVSGHAIDGNTALLGAIIPLVIVGLVVLSIGLIVRTRND